MNYQITKIEFDFTDSLGEIALTDTEQSELYAEILGSIWEATDGDDLVEELTCATGWCIKSIDYRHVLN